MLVSLASEPRNPWLSWDYLRGNHDAVVNHLQQHVTLTVEAVIVALVVSLPLALAAHRWRRLAGPLINVAGVLYTVPSLALFAILGPYTGLLSQRTVLVGLVVYALLVLLRNAVTGLVGVDADVVEAARGMGYGSARLLWRVELPLALPSIITGVRIAAVSTVALVTIGVINGNGGLGQIIDDGFQREYHAEVTTGLVLCVLLALGVDLVILGAGRLLSPWSGGRA